MRVLILSTEKRPPELIEKDIAGIPVESPKVEEPAQSANETPKTEPSNFVAEPEDMEQDKSPEDTGSEAEQTEPNQ